LRAAWEGEPHVLSEAGLVFADVPPVHLRVVDAIDVGFARDEVRALGCRHKCHDDFSCLRKGIRCFVLGGFMNKVRSPFGGRTC